ncbi:hypothetical protein CC1G_11118 [Coprinopsis cinerea okayama7|uniref:Uncharacterized protein n=1 Tax=Coprinopsis cinerea (strain Okayama-7 / 130 / ATCC MYA-4618 / FGSC 9003) TaxID=240176 RepID=A8N4Q3_COPC7|nr:hypothetical protein CC1G_11118 [Coprinopsis cinerea okayama7\|eukprot:XP_001829848.1 hypothetical protein CC1G_11118 [Coprinopsis cinerea okayama7\
MSILSKSFALFLLVSSIVVSVEGNPTPTITIGYRVVNKDAAEAYKKNGNKLSFLPSAGGQQLGHGAYVSPGPGEWPGQMQCWITAKASEWNNAPKVWIPQTGIESINNGKAICGTPLFWQKNSAYREDYIKKKGATPGKAVLFSHIELDPKKEPGPAVQMLIPPGVANDPKYDIRIFCLPPNDPKIPKERISWQSWGIREYGQECRPQSGGGSSSRSPSPAGSGSRSSTPPPKAGPSKGSPKPGSKSPSPGPSKKVKRDLSSYLDLETRAMLALERRVLQRRALRRALEDEVYN